MFNKLVEGVKTTAVRAANGAKKHSPEILVTTGVVTTVFGVVMLCKDTLEAPTIIDECKARLDEIHAAVENEELESYTEVEAKKDTTKVYLQTGVKLGKLYGRDAFITTAGLGCMLASNMILRKRNAQALAAYFAVSKAYTTYRDRVIERFGEETDYQILHNIKQETIEETYTDEKGKEKTRKKKVDVADPNSESMYVRYFLPSNPEWKSTDELNEAMFNAFERVACDNLRRKGQLVLNEVYNQLGFKECTAGLVMGWTYNKENPDKTVWPEIRRKKVYLPDEFGGYTEAWALDFNVDRNVYAEMEAKHE